MTILNDIYRFLKDASDIAKDITVQDRMDMRRNSSLAKMSSQATLQFPVIISNSIDVSTAQNVTKALERQFANFVQIVISMNPYMDLDKDKNVAGYLKRIHQNNPNIMDLRESCINVYTDENFAMYTFLTEGASGNVVGSNKKQMFCVEDHLSKMSINDLYQPAQMSMPVAEATMRNYCRKNQIVMEADTVNTGSSTTANGNSIDADVKFNYQRQQDAYKRAQDAAKRQENIQKMEADYRSKTAAKLSDNDVKKANELVPTTITITLAATKGDTFDSNRNFVVGIKGLMHPVASNEMVSNMLNGSKSGNKFFNFIRWTSGEISFLKDLILNVDGIKDEVIKKHTGGSHWWTTLKRRKTLAKAKNVFSKNQILPNATIVMSAEEVAELKEVYGYDLMDPKNVMKIMNQFFLLGLAIVDDSQELVHFIFDGESNYQVVSYKGLEKENNSKNDFKDIYKLINSGRL